MKQIIKKGKAVKKVWSLLALLTLSLSFFNYADARSFKHKKLKDISSPVLIAMDIPSTQIVPSVTSNAPTYTQMEEAIVPHRSETAHQQPAMERIEVSSMAQQTPVHTPSMNTMHPEKTSMLQEYELEGEFAPTEFEGEEVFGEIETAPELIAENITPETELRRQPAMPTAAEIAGEREFDPGAKERAVIDLVEQGAAYLRRHSIDEAFSAFNHDKKFMKGELRLFAFDKKGICLAYGQQADMVWQDLHELKDTFGTPFVQAFINKAQAGGGWVTYQWRNATQKAYVKEVYKEGKTYIIGCGYYPHSKVDEVVTLVKGAVALFNETIKQNRPIDEVFSTLSYPLGRFIYGDLYLYALDFKGTQMAHGELPGLIGTNAYNYKDAAGKLVNQEFYAKLKEVDFGTGVWVDYISRNAPKRAYGEKVVDSKGNLYFIACGYYPDADRAHAQNLVERFYRYMKANGKTQAARSINDPNDLTFNYGDLYIIIYDMHGVIIADAYNPTIINRNDWDKRDETGALYVQEFIDKANSGGGWVDTKEKNSFKATYVEKINMGVEQFVITCGLYPITKRETMLLLAKGAADYLKSHDADEAFKDFVQRDGKFMRGDLEIFTFDANGICLAYGDEYDLIWSNMMNAKDDKGKPYVKMLINTAHRGPGTVTFEKHGAVKLVHVEPVQKNGKLFVVGSGFYY